MYSCTSCLIKVVSWCNRVVWSSDERIIVLDIHKAPENMMAALHPLPTTSPSRLPLL